MCDGKKQEGKSSPYRKMSDFLSNNSSFIMALIGIITAFATVIGLFFVIADFVKRGDLKSRAGHQRKEQTTLSALSLDIAMAYNNRGIAYVYKREYDRAIEDYNKAIALNPNIAEVYNNRGTAYREKGEYDQAIEDYNKGIDLDPDYAETYDNRDTAYKYKKKKASPLKRLSNFLHDNSPVITAAIVTIAVVFLLAIAIIIGATVYNNHGTAYLNKSEYDRAVVHFNKAIALNPDYVESYNKRGIAYAEKGENGRAIEDFNKAIGLNPDYVYAYNNRGNTYRAIDEYDRAIEDFNKAIELNPYIATVYNNRGTAYADIGAHDRAQEDFDKARALDPNL